MKLFPTIRPVGKKGMNNNGMIGEKTCNPEHPFLYGQV